MKFQINNDFLPLNIVFVLANSVDPAFVVSGSSGSSLFRKVPVQQRSSKDKQHSVLFNHQTIIIPKNSLFPSIPDSFHQ